MKKFPFRLCLFLFLFLFFTVSCKSNTDVQKESTSKNTDTSEAVIELKDKDTEGSTVSSVFSYSRTALENPGQYYLGDGIQNQIYVSGSCLYVPTGNFAATGEVGTTVLQYGADGTLLNEIAIPEFEGADVICSRPLSNNTFLYLCADATGFQIQLFLCDAEQTVLHQTPLSSYSQDIRNFWGDGVLSLHVTEYDDSSESSGGVRIFVNAYDKLYYLDEALQILSMVSIDNEYTGIYQMSDGVYLLGNTLPRMCRADMNTGTVEAIKTMPVPDDMMRNCTYQYGADGNLYCFYNRSVFRCNEDSSLTELVSMQNGMYSAGGGTTWVMDDTHLFYLPPPTDTSADMSSLTLLNIEEDDRVQNRRVITLLSEYRGLDRWLYDVVSKFNAVNEDYYVSLIMPTLDEDFGEVLDARLLSGNAPDLVCFHYNFHITSYIEKDIFLNLSPYFGDALLGCVKNAYTKGDGKQYLLPLSMHLYTYAAATALQSESLSWEQMYRLGKEIENGSSNLQFITSQMEDSRFMPYMISDFYDIREKTANFDSDAFKTRIRFMEACLKSYISHDDGQMLNGDISSNRYVLTNDSIRDAMQNGKIAVLNVPFKTAEAFSALKRVFEDTPYTLCGWPTEDGAAPGAYVDSRDLISVVADSASLGGCKAFLDFLLSDDIQTSDYIKEYYLPVTRSALEKTLYDYRYLYYPDEPITILPSFFTGEPEIWSDISALRHGAQKLENNDTLVLYEMTEEDRAAILDFFDTCVSGERMDTVIWEIVTEELSAYQAGAKTLDAAVKIIQNRVWIYLNE